MSPADQDLEALRVSVRSFTEREVAPQAGRNDREATYSRELFEAMRASDLLGLSLPVEYGGSGGGMSGLCVAIEEVSRACNSAALMLLLSQLCAGPIVLSERVELKKHYVAAVAAGALHGSFCLTEPEVGSDVQSMRSRAVADGSDYLLSGTKAYISGGPLADFFIVWAKVDDGGSPTIAGFVVDRAAPGVSIGHIDDKLGVRAVPTSEVRFEQVRVPGGHRLTDAGVGMKQLMRCLNTARPGVAARGLGLAQGAFAYAADYARHRQAFGQKLLDIQAVQFLLADLAIGIESARPLVYRAAGLVDAGTDGRGAAPFIAMAKCAAADLAVKAASDAIQVMGAAGYMRDHPLERFYRDAKQLQIVEGTSQIQRVIIGRAIRDQIYAP
jgi:acyl-CoA dehydrogenase